MFTKLVLENFLSFKGPVEVPLKKLTVAVGPNNCGKSNLVTAFRYLATIPSRGFSNAAREMQHGLQELLYRGDKAQAFRLGLFAESSTEDVPWSSAQYEIQLCPRDGHTLVQDEQFRAVPRSESQEKEEVRIFGDGLTLQGGQSIACKKIRETSLFYYLTDTSPLAQSFTRHVGSIKHFHFNPVRLREPSQIVAKPSLDPDGKGLAAVLDNLKSMQSERWAALEEDFRRCVPEVQAILLPSSGPGCKSVALKERGARGTFSSQEISDGLLLLLAVLACVYQEPPPAMICIEEPEMGVHARRLRDILDLLYAVAEGRAGSGATQILLTTHSPYLLDHFKDDLDAVLVLERGDEGTTVKRASEILGPGGLHGSPLGEVYYAGTLGGVPE